jgi:nucleoside-diphosphate-sugar epimerase
MPMSRARASRDVIERERAERSARFLLTGGTGFLGSHVAVELLKRGYRVTLLARPANGLTAEGRVGRLLDWFGLPDAARRGLRVVEGDITRPELGVGPAVFRELARDTDEIVHCASNTSFSERKRSEVEAVNADGLSHVLAFARDGDAHFFHHVSTAFVAGQASGPCPEAPVAARGFHNVYEETKWKGEALATEACGRAGIGLAIYRPSIVYGDSRTGRSLLFNAVYFPVRAAVFLKETFEKDIRERGGRRAAELGVRIEPDGTTHLPLRVETAGRGGLNLVPVDFFTETFLALLEAAPAGGVFHIVNSRTKSIDDIAEYTSRFFRISGVRVCAPEEFAARPKNPLERLYDQYIEAYAPYMKDVRTFETPVSGPILGRRGIVCPEFDYDVFSRCMDYAVRTGWGARLFEGQKE